MADCIAENLSGELSYETPRIQEMTIPADVVCGMSPGPDGGLKAYNEDGLSSTSSFYDEEGVLKE